MKQNAFFGIALLLTTLVAVYLYDRWSNCREDYRIALSQLEPEQDKDFVGIERIAVQEWTQKYGTSNELVLVGRRPVTLAMGTERCVALVLDRGALGPQPVYCFDENDQLTREFDN